MLLSVVLGTLTKRGDLDLLENSREQQGTWMERNKCQETARWESANKSFVHLSLTRIGPLWLHIFKKSHLKPVIH